MIAVRRFFVAVHGYTGLVVALFLIIEGLTGSLLAFNSALDKLFNPQFYATPAPLATRMNLGSLAAKAQKLEPSISVDYLFNNPNQIDVHVEPRTSNGKSTPSLGFTEIILDPWTGKELGRREQTDYSQGLKNVMPLIYNLHFQLIGGGYVGTTLLGIVAFVWTIDCFVSLYLTFPTVRREFWKRWQMAWGIKRTAGSFRLHFDIHRAGGLWLWPILLVFAWSSVMLAWPDAWWKVTSSIMPTQTFDAIQAQLTNRTLPKRALSWEQANVVGRHLLEEQGRLRGFAVGEQESMAYIGFLGVYSYSAWSSFDVRGERADSGVYFDADTGKLRALFMPQHQYLGNTLNTWLWGMHYGDLHDNILYRIAVSIIGVLVAIVAWTGVVIYFKKRSAERLQRRRSHAAAERLS